MSRNRDRSGASKKPVETFITGLIITVVFGGLLRANLIPGGFDWFFVFPLIFGGILPMVRGLTGMIRGGVSKVVGQDEETPQIPRPAEKPVDTKTDSERKILVLAREEGGIVTPALVALKTDLSLDKAGEILEDLARRGHAGMQVMDDGRVVYSFPEFERGRKALPGS